MLQFTDSDSYQTPPRKLSFLKRKFPSFVHYWQIMCVILRSSRKARKGLYGVADWSLTSRGMFESLESVGVQFSIDGFDELKKLAGPCVFVCNHMSTLETFVLPYLLLPFGKICFVIKQSLVEYPVFKHIMKACRPIVVGRTNPREDLKTVLMQGVESLQHGTAVVIFPQTTRCVNFSAEQFNSIGIKLAKKAGVPVVPIAVKTDAWENGKRFKDFGRINPQKRVYISFGAPLPITGNGKEQHEAVIEFILRRFASWAE